MFNSTLLDVIIGLVFCFASVALFVSSIHEFIASILKLRHKTLLRGLQQMLNDPDGSGIVRALYQHALINPMTLVTGAQTAGSQLPPAAAIGAPPVAPVAGAMSNVVAVPFSPTWSKEAIPAYIASKDFAQALIDVIKSRPGVTTLQHGIDSIADAQLRQVLQGLFARAQQDADKFTIAIADWFDNAMDRLSGNYKRNAQKWTFIIGLVVAVVLNIDTFYLLSQLWARPAYASAITAPAAHDLIDAASKLAHRQEEAKRAEDVAAAAAAKAKAASATDAAVLAQTPAAPATTEAGNAATVATLPDPAASAAKFDPEALMTTLKTLPVGWGLPRTYPGFDEFLTGKFWKFYIFFFFGLAVTASSALFGAPFWFDLLQRLIQVRGTGTKPPTNRDKDKPGVTAATTP